MSHAYMPVKTKAVVSAPLSYSGATKRMLARPRRPNNIALKALACIGISLVLVTVYAFVTLWYLLVITIFSWLFFPWRLHRRHQRRELAESQRTMTPPQSLPNMSSQVS